MSLCLRPAMRGSKALSILVFTSLVSPVQFADGIDSLSFKAVAGSA